LGLGPNVEFVFKDILNIVYCSPSLTVVQLFRGRETGRFGPKIGIFGLNFAHAAFGGA